MCLQYNTLLNAPQDNATYLVVVMKFEILARIHQFQCSKPTGVHPRTWFDPLQV
ncbi:uncharacterized protein CANTADRAFT_25503 [Suhomyces tanzawaensis NRRL Y-17324]|uniref:Uncharacterized protein n=1 Tax=Suhomyces tanzawaensis NRRL Y-17324 TaxID=984487 RepID=A0A1E4SPA6_9ASCO|nr:uncharacterized protein CANTADRAFT_25503 [Suhomyces tanzawaensis NRRL Y-17324]ODV81318.1 hypothetical protein CANTADRAFT_25503 [Suhomyces tanzawaensis NRRL Y-17324]